MFSLLDEESRFPKSSDVSFVNKLSTNHQKNKNFGREKRADPTQFGVKHYAGTVSVKMSIHLVIAKRGIADKIKKIKNHTEFTVSVRESNLSPYVFQSVLSLTRNRSDLGSVQTFFDNRLRVFCVLLKY